MMKKSLRSELARLAENIRCLRENMNLSQGEFARAVGVRQQKVSDWERGLGLRAVVEAWRLANVLSGGPQPRATAGASRNGRTPSNEAKTRRGGDRRRSR